MPWAGVFLTLFVVFFRSQPHGDEGMAIYDKWLVVDVSTYK